MKTSIHLPPFVVRSSPMIEDDMTPAEREQFDASVENDLADIAEELHGLPKTIPDLTAAIAELDQRIEHKRREMAELLKWEEKDLSTGQAVPVREDLRREISRLEARRNDYLAQVSQKN